MTQDNVLQYFFKRSDSVAVLHRYLCCTDSDHQLMSILFVKPLSIETHMCSAVLVVSE